MAETRKLQFTIDAQDNTKAGFSGASKSLDDLKEKSSATESAINSFGTGILAVDAAVGAFGLSAIKSASDYEQLNMSFTTMLGSADQATKMMDDMQQFANKTPFEMSDVAKASQTLLAFGVDAKSIIPDVQMIGDVSLGNKEKFQSLSLAFAQVQSTGRLMGQDLLQMVNQGFNPLQIISEKTGISMAKLKDKMADGAISADMVSAAFKIATSEGGRFHNGMANASTTLAGRWSTLQDYGSQLMRVIGQQLTPAVGGLIDKMSANAGTAIEWVKNHQQAIATAIQYTGAILGAITAVLAINKAIQISKALFMALNSPIGAIVIIASLLAAGLVAMSNKFGGVSNAIKVVGLSIQALGQVFVLGFKMMGNTAINFINGVLDKGNQAYNWVVDLINKMGGHMEKINMHINYSFDEGATTAELAKIGAEVNKMESDAAKAKQDASDKAIAASKAEVSQAQKAANQKGQITGKDLENMMKAGDGNKKASSAAKKAQEEIKKLNDKLSDMKKAYSDAKTSAVNSLAQLDSDNQEKMKSIQDDISKTIQSIADLNQEYAKNTADNTKSIAEQVVDTEKDLLDKKKEVEKAKADLAAKQAEADAAVNKKAYEEDIANLQKSLEEKKKTTSSTNADILALQKSLDDKKAAYNTAKTSDEQKDREKEIADLQKTLAEKQKAYDDEKAGYDSAAGFITTIQDAVTEARRRAGETELQRAIEDYKAKQLLAQQEYDSKMIKLSAELAAKQQEMLKEVDLYNSKVAKIKEIEATAQKEYQKIMDAHYKKTVDTVSAEIEVFNKLAKAISAAQSASSISVLNTKTSGATSTTTTKTTVSGKKAAGGPVLSGKTYLVGENGPELFSPAGNGSIIPRSSGAREASASSIIVNIDVNGNEFVGEEGIADRIFSKLMRQIKDVVPLG